MKTTRPDLPDATTLLEQMASGEKSAETIMQEHLERLRRTQPRFNGATQIMAERALSEARNPRPGPLSGLPLSVKETFDIAGERVTVGSKRRKPTIPTEDADVVRRLRAAGAIVIARSNIPELAMAGETDNPVFGRTNNALDTARTAGGSSGGEGVLVATGASAIGIGNDILGSIRIPAAFNGIVGFKPASTSVEKRGTWPALHDAHLNSWLGIGPLTRTVRDARLVSSVIFKQPLPSPADVRGLRLVIPDQFRLTVAEPAIERALVRAKTVLEAAGMHTEQQTFGDIDRIYGYMQKMVVHDFEASLLKELSPAGQPPFSRLRELVRQLRGQPTIYDGLFQLLFLMPLLRPRSSAVPGLVATIAAIRRKYHALLGKDGVLLLPTMGMLAPKHGQMNRDSLRPGVNAKMTPVTFANIMDLPSITLPAWRDQDAATGLPPAIMLACAPGAEGALLDAAAALEAGIR